MVWEDIVSSWHSHHQSKVLQTDDIVEDVTMGALHSIFRGSFERWYNYDVLSLNNDCDYHIRHLTYRTQNNTNWYLTDEKIEIYTISVTHPDSSSE